MYIILQHKFEIEMVFETQNNRPKQQQQQNTRNSRQLRIFIVMCHTHSPCGVYINYKHNWIGEQAHSIRSDLKIAGCLFVVFFSLFISFRFIWFLKSPESDISKLALFIFNWNVGNWPATKLAAIFNQFSSYWFSLFAIPLSDSISYCARFTALESGVVDAVKWNSDTKPRWRGMLL